MVTAVAFWRGFRLDEETLLVIAASFLRFVTVLGVSCRIKSVRGVLVIGNSGSTGRLESVSDVDDEDDDCGILTLNSADLLWNGLLSSKHK